MGLCWIFSGVLDVSCIVYFSSSAECDRIVARYYIEVDIYLLSSCVHHKAACYVILHTVDGQRHTPVDIYIYT